MKKLLVALLFTASASATQVPLPPSVVSVNDIVAEFRNVLTTKIEDIGKNFISTTVGKKLIFTNDTDLKCNGKTTPAGQPVSSLTYAFKQVEKELSEKVIYSGCNEEVSLVEDVVTRGENLKPLSYTNLTKGKREFDLVDGEIFKLYRLSNADNEEIFKLLIEKTPRGKIAEFFIVGQKFLTLNYEFNELKSSMIMTFRGYSGKYIRKYSRWEFDVKYLPFNQMVQVNKGEIIDAIFFDANGIRIGQSDFLSMINYYLLAGPLSRIRKILEYHNYYFPSTEIVKTGSQNEKLKEELRILFNRLQNNTEINLIKKQIQDYIDAVEKGLLIDNRPKE